MIADSPARPKITYSHQYKGAYGCFTCMNKGVKLGRKARFYEYKPTVELRSAQLYKKQVRKIRIAKLGLKKVNHYKGFKGKSWFSKYCSLTEALVIDFMHLLGLVKHMLGLLFDSKNSKTGHYLGNIDFFISSYD